MAKSIAIIMDGECLSSSFQSKHTAKLANIFNGFARHLLLRLRQVHSAVA